MTADPQHAELVLVDLLPGVFPGSWGLLLEQRPDGTVAVVAATPGAPEAEGFTPPWLPLERATRVLADPSWAPPSWHDVIAAIAPLSTPTRVVVAGRNGGPETLDSEVMRLAHLAAWPAPCAASAASSDHRGPCRAARRASRGISTGHDPGACRRACRVTSV
jgi:hypothetical protein